MSKTAETKGGLWRCYAGVWAKNADRINNVLEPMSLSQDSFTHGSSEQRVRWLKRGYDSGSMADCDTFRADTL